MFLYSAFLPLPFLPPNNGYAVYSVCKIKKYGVRSSRILRAIDKLDKDCTYNTILVTTNDAK